MAHAYTPGLSVNPSTLIIRTRELPLLGRCLVKEGDLVTAEQAVLSAELPGDLDIIRVADRMGLDPQVVAKGMQVKEGDAVTKGQLLCEVKTFFGLFTTRLESPVSGTVEFFTEANAHLAVRHKSKPISVNAYIDGKVTEVVKDRSVTIETEAAFIQGIFGVGGERLGTIAVLPVANDKVVTVEDIRAHLPKLSQQIIIGGATYSIEALRFVASSGAVGVVTGSIESEVLREYVGHDIGISVTGDEHVTCTLIVTEGFGRLSMTSRIVDLARTLSGRRASINGATQVRAGAVRPELVIVSPTRHLPTQDHQRQSTPSLEVNSRVRVIRVPYFGVLGTVLELPTNPQAIETGATVRVIRLRLDSGQVVTVARANVELV